MAISGDTDQWEDKDLIKYCSSCQEVDGSHVETVQFCGSCGDTLCSRCTAQHSRHKLNRLHTIIPIAETSVLQFQASRVTIDEDCPLRHGKTVALLCVTHQQLCCQICVSSAHNKCNNFMTLEDSVELFSSFKKKEEKGEMTEMIKELKELQSKKTETLVMLKECTRAAEKLQRNSDINTFQKAKGDLDVYCDDQSKLLERQKEALEKLENVISEENKIYEMFPYFSPRQVFIASKCMFDKIQQTYEPSKNILEMELEELDFQDSDPLAKVSLNSAKLREICIKNSQKDLELLNKLSDFLESHSKALEIHHMPQVFTTAEPNSNNDNSADNSNEAKRTVVKVEAKDAITTNMKHGDSSKEKNKDDVKKKTSTDVQVEPKTKTNARFHPWMAEIKLQRTVSYSELNIGPPSSKTAAASRLSGVFYLSNGNCLLTQSDIGCLLVLDSNLQYIDSYMGLHNKCPDGVHSTCRLRLLPIKTEQCLLDNIEIAKSEQESSDRIFVASSCETVEVIDYSEGQGFKPIENIKTDPGLYRKVWQV